MPRGGGGVEKNALTYSMSIKKQFTQELKDGGTDDWVQVRHERIPASDKAGVGGQEPPIKFS